MQKAQQLALGQTPITNISMVEYFGDCPGFTFNSFIHFTVQLIKTVDDNIIIIIIIYFENVPFSTLS